MVKLFVVGYPTDMQEVELIELFVLYGMIHSISMIKDKDSHKSLGYCFIEMLDQAGADRAIGAINGTVVKGRKVTVKLAGERHMAKNNAVSKQNNAYLAVGIRNSEKSDVPGLKAKSKRPRKAMASKNSVVTESNEDRV
jgi:RNA recognition motif-containing protein